MVLKRYLIFFSYVGTNFRGVRRRIGRGNRLSEDPSTVQGLIEIAISRLKPKNDVVLHLSSRTEQGEHAFKNAGTVDLDLGNDIKTKDVVNFVNEFFDTADLDIRIQEMCRVNDSFNNSNVLWRKYMYKFATLKPNISAKQYINRWSIPIPVLEYKRCYYALVKNFYCERVNEVKDLFVGPNDFITFQSKTLKNPVEKSTVKEIMSLEIKPSITYLPFPYNNFDYWNVTIQGNSFLRRQICKMVSVLIEVGCGRLAYSDVKNMLDNPCEHSWPDHLPTAPNHGLYLMEVHYDPNSLICVEADEERKQVNENGMDKHIDHIEKRETFESIGLQELEQLKEIKAERNRYESE